MSLYWKFYCTLESSSFDRRSLSILSRPPPPLQVERNKRPADSTASFSVNPASVAKGPEDSPTKSSADANGATGHGGDSDDSDDD